MVFRWLVIFGLITSSLWAQAPVEILVPRKTVKEKLVPLIINKNADEIQSQLFEKLEEINQGFTRQQIVEVPLYDLIKDAEEDIEKLLSEYSSNRDEWNALIEKMKFMKIRGTFDLRIQPEAESFEVQFSPTTSDRALAQVTGTVVARPEISLEDLTDLQFIEIDQNTGEESRVDLPGNIRRSLRNSLRFKMPQTSVELTGVVTENLSDPNQKDLLSVELLGWKSSFSTVQLEQAEIEKFLGEVIRGPNFFALKSSLSRTKAFKNIINSPDAETRNLIERDVKAFLDRQTTEIVLWVERLKDNSFEVHLSSGEDENRMKDVESARREGRLFLEARSTIPLKGKDLKIRYDDRSRLASAEFTPHEIFSEDFQLKHIALPEEWKSAAADPIVKSIIEPLYHGNLAAENNLRITPTFRIGEGAARIYVPIHWKDGAPQWNTEKASVSLDFLNSTEVEKVALQLNDREGLQFNFKSDTSLKDQFIAQLIPILKIHEEALGGKFFENAEKDLLKFTEEELLRTTFSIPQTAKGPGLSLKITELDLAKSADISCAYDAGGKPLSMKELLNVSRYASHSGARLPWDSFNRDGMLDVECSLTLPRRISLLATSIKDAEGNVSSIDFGLRAPEDGAAPQGKMKLRILRDKETGVIYSVPLSVDIADALAKYQIPTAGDGAPKIGFVQANGFKGVVQGGVYGASLLWNAWLAPKTKSIQQTNEGLIMHLGTTALTFMAQAFVRESEVETVDELLRRGVEKFKSSAGEEIADAVSDRLNGDLRGRFQISEKQRLAPSVFLDDGMKPKRRIHDYYPRVNVQTLDRGYLGLAEAQIDTRLQEIQKNIPLGRPIAQLEVESGVTLIQSAEESVKETVVQTLDNIPGGIEDVSRAISNPTLSEDARRVKGKAEKYLQDVVSAKADQIEQAVVAFVRERSDPSTPAPIESINQALNEKLLEAMRTRTVFQGNFVQLPAFCGISTAKTQLDQAQEMIYSVMPKVDTAGDGKFPPLSAPRPAGSANVSQVFSAMGSTDVIPLSISTDFIESIANDPQNIRRIEEGIESHAKSMRGISDKFTVDIQDIKVRINEAGQSLIRVKVKIDQPAEGLQTITSAIGFLPDMLISAIAGKDVKFARSIAGLPGWIGDRLTSDLIQVVDGYMYFEIPFNASVGDVQSSDGIVKGHYLTLWPDAKGFKILHKEGWKSLVGGIAEERIEENIVKFQHDVAVDQPLAVPGFENETYFKLGNDLSEVSNFRKTILPIPTAKMGGRDEEGLYSGSLVIRGRLFTKGVAEGYPSFKVTKAPSP